MTRNLRSQHLAAAHEHLQHVLGADDLAAIMQTINLLFGDVRRHPMKLATAPPHAPAQPRPPTLPSTYFRLNETLDLVEIAPPLLDILEIDSPADLLGDKWTQYIVKDDLKRLFEMAMFVAQMREGCMFRFRTPRGRELILRERVFSLRDHRTLKHYGWVGYVEPVSKVIKIDEPRPPARTPKQRSA